MDFFKKIVYLCDSCAEYVRHKIHVKITVFTLEQSFINIKKIFFPRLAETCFFYTNYII